MNEIYIWAENTIRAGHRAWEPDASEDVILFEGDDAKIIEYADDWERGAAAGAAGAYQRRVAKTLRDAVS